MFYTAKINNPPISIALKGVARQFLDLSPRLGKLDVVEKFVWRPAKSFLPSANVTFVFVQSRLRLQHRRAKLLIPRLHQHCRRVNVKPPLLASRPSEPPHGDALGSRHLALHPTLQRHGIIPQLRNLREFFDRIYKIYRILGTWGYTPRIELACGDFAALGGYPR